ncbi:DUF4145 domain-containing protein [Enterococcus hirae]|uniref:DUF4145 domain-containing protein n=1 Tax=Enterococcus hirae TaxID=1354 RepID=UPI0009BF036D|nr:DUF4145 domain-containing protein [Enterococcus hirae]OQO52374.1 hypothetical protein BH734_09235 [Enterococcus hirae]
MEKKITLYYSDNTTEKTTVSLNPICPHCGIPIDPTVISANSNSLYSELSGTFGVFLSCTNSECKKYHVQAFNYSRYAERHPIKVEEKIIYSYKPMLSNDLPKEINDKFPEFSSIYDQSLEAESMGLDQIAGVGFRKSLEFLIKSYAIELAPNKRETIEKEALMNTIKTRYNDFPKIQKLAELATWIGNDETHFVKKHTSIDIQDMKRFIRSASLFIAADIDVDFATSYIEDDKSKRN